MTIKRKNKRWAEHVACMEREREVREFITVFKIIVLSVKRWREELDESKQ
jgi:hypothetical protein